MLNFNVRLILGLYLFFFASSFAVIDRSSFPEIIQEFQSAITVHEDGTMTVEETIDYVNYSKLGRHGIFREFPTNYYDTWGNNIIIQFNIIAITRDNQPINYHTENLENGVRIYIGDADIIVPPGEYRYKIIYSTSRQLGFFKDHDELYWNVTGNGWRFPIMHAQATVQLPKTIPTNNVELEAYTGLQGEQGKNYKTEKKPDGKFFLETTESLAPREGLTIVVSFPKGFIQEPTIITKIGYLFWDNLWLIILVFGFLLIVLLYLVLWLHVRSKLIHGTIIPRFRPPADLSPGALRYIYRLGYDHKVVAAEIVNMAVHGIIKIKHQAHFWSSSYELEFNYKTPEELLSEKATLAEKIRYVLAKQLFKDSNAIILKGQNNKRVKKATDALKDFLKKQYSYCFNFHHAIIGMCALISILAVFAAMIIIIFWGNQSIPLLGYVFGFFYIGVNWLFAYLLRTYTQEGLKLKEEIEGFKLFLSTTETERMHVIGTPPTKTPELYEHYLPYAIALGVEKQWSQQFASVFEQLARSGHAYVPLWYGGNRPFYAQNVSKISADLSSSLSSVIASASTPPGYSSGKGGRGSSGGGGGGGGGGSW